jgi:hypothetical protein
MCSSPHVISVCSVVVQLVFVFISWMCDSECVQHLGCGGRRWHMYRRSMDGSKRCWGPKGGLKGVKYGFCRRFNMGCVDAWSVIPKLWISSITFFIRTSGCPIYPPAWCLSCRLVIMVPVSSNFGYCRLNLILLTLLALPVIRHFAMNTWRKRRHNLCQKTIRHDLGGGLQGTSVVQSIPCGVVVGC